MVRQARESAPRMTDHRLFQPQAAHFFRHGVFPQLLPGQLGRHAGDDKRAHNGIDKGIAGVQRFGDEINDNGRGHRHPAHHLVFFYHVERRAHQHKANARHHGVHNGIARKGSDGRQCTRQAQHHHNKAAKHYHGKAVAPCFAHVAGHHNGFGLERNGGHRVQHAAPHCANGKAQRRGHGGKPVAKRQQALRDAVQHNANGCQNVLQEFQKKHPFLKNRAAPQGNGQLCRKTPLLSRILRNARTIYYNKAFLYGNQGRPPHCGHFPQKGPCAPQALQHARGHKTRARATAQALQFLFCGPAGAHGAGRLPRRAGRLRLVTPRLFRIWRCPACPLAPDTPPKTPRRPRGAAGQTALPCPAFPEAHRPRRKSR